MKNVRVGSVWVFGGASASSMHVLGRANGRVQSRPPNALALAGLVLALGLQSCSKKEELPPAKPARPPEASVAKKGATKPDDVSITGVHIGLGIGEYSHVAHEQSSFTPKDTIALSVYSDGWAKTATIGVRWLAPKGELMTEVSKDVVYNGSLATPFTFSMPAGLPIGKCKVEVYLNGWRAETAEFEVK